ncbi:MAG: GTPase HflX [Clostridiales bacterium]|nr:GTPase HflX [Clostridiales bacterium]
MNCPDKIKKELKLKLEELEGKKFEKSLFIDEEILKTISFITGETGYEVALVIDRKGNILDVTVGDKSSASIVVDGGDNRFAGVRVIHTHPSGDSSLSNMDISLLKNKKLDAMCAVAVRDKKPYDCKVAYLTGDKVTIVNCHNADYINKYGLIDKIFESEKLYKEYYSNLNKLPEQRAILVKVALKQKGNIEEDLEELERLAETAGVMVVDKMSQFRVKPDGTYFIGSGKIDNLKDLIQIHDANLIIFDNELTGSKVSNISNALGVKVIDRSMLILDIFAGRARTTEGKLQVELAQLKYSLPRLGAYLESSGRFGGGVGMRGPGETKLELNRRIVESQIQKKTEDLKKLKKQRDLNRKNRQKNDKPIIAIVGYTNSGKSTLLNKLAKSSVYVKDELFATLDTTTRNVWLQDGKEVLMIDTVGFINNLPHEFIEAFSSTLEESIYADLILHVVDISNPNYKSHIAVTNEVLRNLQCKSPVVMVYNKCDKEMAGDENNGVYVSAMTGVGLDNLKQKIIDMLF